MATQTAKRIIVDVQANTKNFTVQMSKAEDAISRVRKETHKSQSSMQRTSKVFSNAAVATATLHGPLNAISGRLSSMATAFRTVNPGLILFGVTATTVIATLTKGYKTFVETERQIARIEGVLTATGHASGQTAESIDKLSRSIAMNTLASTENVRAAAAALATFTSVTGANFERTLSLSQDLAEVMGVDIKSAAVQLAKAMDEPIRGLNSLSRQGVTFNEQQREQIELLSETGRKYEAIELLLQAVEGQIKGVGAAAAAETHAGSWDTLGQQVTEFAEAAWNSINASEALKKTLDGIAAVLQLLKETLNIEFMPQSELEMNYRFHHNELKKIDESRKKANKTSIILLAKLDRAERKHLAELRYYEDEMIRRGKDNWKKSEAEKKGLQVAAQRRAAEAAAYAKRVAEEQIEIQEKLNRMTGSSDVSSAVTKEDKVIAQYTMRIEALEAYRNKVTEEHGSLLGMEEEFETSLALLRANFAAERIQAVEDDEEAILKILEKTQKFHQDRADEEIAIKKRLYRDTVDGYTAMFGHLADAAKEGSREQAALLVLEKAMAITKVSLNMAIGLSEALKKGWPMSMAEYATTAAQGAAIISGLVGLSVSGRAAGGPVAPGGRYMVGEHGPELFTPSAAGQITSNEAISPNVNVTIVEDAERAGSVNQEGNDIQVYVAAAMKHLNDEFNSGRGLFGAMENKYGLSR